MKLNVSVYALCDALCSWYSSLKSVLLKAGAIKSNFDDSIFFLLIRVKSNVLCVVTLILLESDKNSLN